ncbi:MAG: flagellar basal-body rod protein FlgF [Pseudomonadota bacterium]
MDTTLYVALSHQAAMRRSLDLIANNIANMNTTAFRREQVMFQDYVVELDRLDTDDMKDVAFVQDYGVARDFRQGKMEPTGNPLDLAISGRGFFEVEDPEDGEVNYTRNGSLKISDEGFLATNSGQVVRSEGGGRIEIPADAKLIEIAADGTVSTSQGVAGRIKLVNFENEQLLKKVGDTLFSSEEPPIDPIDAKIVSGMIEGSNVQPLVEMTNMMKVMRSYQSVNNLTEKFEEMRTNSMRSLGRVQ